jgi:hypothetical protein
MHRNSRNSDFAHTCLGFVTQNSVKTPSGGNESTVTFLSLNTYGQPVIRLAALKRGSEMTEAEMYLRSVE